MKCPASRRLSSRTPVSIPIPRSMYTTSSVATFPLAPRAYGHPPSPAVLLSTTVTPEQGEMCRPFIVVEYNTFRSAAFLYLTVSEAGEDVGEGLAVRVVAVEGEAGGGDEPGDGGQHGLHGAGGGHADRVPQRDLVAAHLVQPGRHARHLLRLDGALVGAARHAGHVAAHRHAVRLGRGHHRLEAGEALLYRAVDVLLAATSDHQILQFNLYT